MIVIQNHHYCWNIIAKNKCHSLFMQVISTIRVGEKKNILGVQAIIVYERMEGNDEAQHTLDSLETGAYLELTLNFEARRKAACVGT